MSKRMKNSMKVFGAGIVGAGTLGTIGASMPSTPASSTAMSSAMGGINIMMAGETAKIGMNMMKKLK